MNTVIRKVWLSFNALRSEGVVLIAEALENDALRGGKIEKIFLANNKIGQKGARALARMLETNTALKEIVLDNNPMIGKPLNERIQQLLTIDRTTIEGTR